MTRSTLMHGIEAFVCFLFGAFALYLFQEPLTELLVDLFHRSTIVSAIESGLIIFLGALFSALSKRLRMDPEIPQIPDFVNPEETVKKENIE